MGNSIFTGAGVAIVTPMRPDGSVDFDLLGTLIDWQLDNGTDAIVATGTTGESPVLTDEEHAEVIRYAVKRTAGRVPVIAGTGSNDTAYALDLSLEAKEAGVDALLMVTPYYNKASQKGLVNHYTYLADRIEMPIIVYNVPSRTGVNIVPETYLELSKHPYISAVKEANGDFSAIAKIALFCGDNLDIYSGNDDQIVPIMALGGKGVISVLSNVLPQGTHDIVAACLSGDYERGRALQLQYLALANQLFCDVSPIPVKAALNLMGYPVGECRMPLSPLSEAHLEALKVVLTQNHLL